MKSISCILLISLVTLFSCGKKDKGPKEQTPEEVVVTEEDPGLTCQDLPPTPIPFGWQDSITDPNKQINAFLFDPVDANKILYVANGDNFGYNKLFFYTIPTKAAKYVCTLGEYLPQVNRKGWITFSDVENNIFLVKQNGDSLVKLTNDKHSKNPHWDYSGNFIYFFVEGYSIYAARIAKVDIAGNTVDEFFSEQPYAASFKKSDHLIVLETINGASTLVLKDMKDAVNDRALISAPLYSKPGQVYFDNLVVDNTDENFYWSNSNGIFKCNLNSLKVETLFKNCQNFIYNNPIISFKDNEMTYSHDVIRPVSSVMLWHQYKTMELNLVTGQSNEVTIYP